MEIGVENHRQELNGLCHCDENQVSGYGEMQSGLLSLETDLFLN